ncbi:TraR/DksA family transcriptional regulator [Aurantivibrio plasticivorans]
MKTDEIKSLLAKQESELTTRISKIELDLRREHSRDSEEQAQERENDEVLEALATEAKESLTHIQAALQRIEDGSYGRCESCGEDIGTARLEAIPDTVLCIQCAD